MMPLVWEDFFNFINLQDGWRLISKVNFEVKLSKVQIPPKSKPWLIVLIGKVIETAAIHFALQVTAAQCEGFWEQFVGSRKASAAPTGHGDITAVLQGVRLFVSGLVGRQQLGVAQRKLLRQSI